MTCEVECPVGVEALSVADCELPSLVLIFREVGDRISTEGNTLILRYESGRTGDTVVHLLLECIEADLELVPETEIDTDVGLLDLLRLEGCITIDRLVGVVAEVADHTATVADNLVLVSIPVDTCRIVTGNTIRSADLEEGDCRDCILDEAFVGSDPRS